MLRDLLPTLAAFLHRDARNAICMSYEHCITLKIPPCKLQRNEEHDAQLERVLCTRLLYGGEVELFDVTNQLWIYMDVSMYGFFEMSVTTRIDTTSVSKPTYEVQAGSEMRTVTMYASEVRTHSEVVRKKYTLESHTFPQYVLIQGQRIPACDYWTTCTPNSNLNFIG